MSSLFNITFLTFHLIPQSPCLQDRSQVLASLYNTAHSTSIAQLSIVSPYTYHNTPGLYIESDCSASPHIAMIAKSSIHAIYEPRCKPRDEHYGCPNEL